MERLARKEVAESGLEFLLVEFVEYVLRREGHGVVQGSTDHTGKGKVADLPLETDADEAGAAAAEARGKLEAMGYDVGLRVVERMAMEKERLETELEIIKYICKEFWEQMFKKQIDVLRTNHRGLFVLQDNNFRWLRFVSESGEGGSPEDYAIFPCGIVCGALQRLGLSCTVTVDATRSPKALFNVQIKQHAPDT